MKDARFAIVLCLHFGRWNVATRFLESPWSRAIRRDPQYERASDWRKHSQVFTSIEVAPAIICIPKLSVKCRGYFRRLVAGYARKGSAGRAAIGSRSAGPTM